MNKEKIWTCGNDHKKEIGEKFEARIRHCNPALNMDDETVILRVADDGYYLDSGHEELSYNWDVIKCRDL